MISPEELARLRKIERVAKATVKALLTNEDNDPDWGDQWMTLDVEALWKLVAVINPDAAQRNEDAIRAIETRCGRKRQ